MLQALAEKYAQIAGTTVLSSNEHDGQITFVLSTGPKYTMTETELTHALDELQGTKPKSAPPATTHRPAGVVPAGETNQPAEEETPKRKPRAK